MGERAKKQKAQKPQYRLWQNVGYMLSLSWRQEKSVLWLSVLLALSTVAVQVVELWITPVILGKIEQVAPLSELLWTIAALVGALLLTRGLNTWLTKNTVFSRISLRIEILKRILDKLGVMSYPNTEDALLLKKMDKAVMATSDNASSTEAIWATMTQLLQNVLGFVIYLFVLSSVDPFLILIILLTTVGGYFASKRINEWGYRHREEEEEYSRRMNYVKMQSEDRALAKDIRIFGMRPWLEEVYRKTLRLYQSFMARGERIYFWADVIDVALTFLRNGIAYAYLIFMTLRQGLPASDFLLYFSAAGGFSTWVTGILSGFSTLRKQGMDLSIVQEFLNTPEPFLFEEGKPLEPDPDGKYEITLRNVSFRYPGAEADTLSHIHLTIRPGEKLAVVGINGAGKTTLIKLICGFYDPTEGEILLNGEDIRQYNRRDYYRHFAAVFQQFSVLETTIGDNIAQAIGSIDRQRAAECIEKAGLTQKVDSLPHGYGTHFGRSIHEDGVELSGGETQRLMLARALYKGAPIVILDEPTAALDPIAESDLYQKYSDLTGNATSVYISHRLASTRFCDRILYLENGTIAEEGTHESLLQQNGKYAKLFAIQSRYYREGGEEDEETGIG